MEIGYEEVEMLRMMLIDYYGSAMGNFGMAMVDMERIRAASAETIVQEAIKVGIFK